MVAPIPLRTVSPVAGNLLCVAIGKTMNYAAIYTGVYTIYTPPGQLAPQKA